MNETLRHIDTFAEWDRCAYNRGGQLLKSDPINPDGAVVVFFSAGLYDELSEHLNVAHARSPVNVWKSNCIYAGIPVGRDDSFDETPSPEQSCPYVQLVPAISYAFWLMAPPSEVLNSTKLVYEFPLAELADDAAMDFKRATKRKIAHRPWDEVHAYTCA